MTLQNIFSKNYKWWYFINYQFKLSFGNFSAFLINTTVRTIEFLAIIYIWKINNSLPAVITYLAIGRVFEKLIFSEIEGQVSYLIIKGGLSRWLLYPTNFFGYMICDNIGYNFFRTSINSLIILVLSLLLFQNDIILSSNTLYLIPMFFVGYGIKTFWSFIMSSVAFWQDTNANSHNIIDAIRVLSTLFSGSIIPLYLIFTGIFNFLLYTPFAYTLHHPMQIYLGKYDPNQTLLVFLGGTAWCLILWILARIVFKMGLKKNEAVGL